MDYMQLMIWAGGLAVALFILIRGADVFITGAKQIGVAMKLSPFIIGVLIVGLGTSLPELASSIAGVLDGSPEIVAANVVGSNITNILLIIGLIAFLKGPIIISRDLLKTELPLFFIATVHFVLAISDGTVDRVEALLLTATFGAYLWYTLASTDGGEKEETTLEEKKFKYTAIVFVVLGIVGVLVGAHYTVEMAVNIATAMSVPIGLVSIAAIAIGTSLPELFVSFQAAKTGETELAIGNIFGSNAFNALMVVGIPGLMTALPAGAVVMELGLGVMVAASLMLFVSGLAKQVHRWEGLMLLIFFGFFLVKLTNFL